MLNQEKIHLDIQTHRSKPYGLLRTYTKGENGKLKRTTLARLNNLSKDQLLMIRAALQGNTVPKSEFSITSSKEYGASYVLLEMAKALELDKTIYSRPSEQWVKDCLAMIVGRIIFSGSKLSLTNVHKDSSLWDLSGHEGKEHIDVNKHCYDAMDKLLSRQKEIQKKLANRHLNKGSIVLYDITSSYFEGEYKNSQKVTFGYNRDKKRGKAQVVIGLMCDSEGCPFAVEVFRGNTKDETTVMDKIKELKKSYDFTDLVFVGDRGMITKSRFEEINKIDEFGEKPDYIRIISALTHADIKKLCEKYDSQLTLFDEKNIVELIDTENSNIRYGLCLNPAMRAEERKTRTTLLEKTEEALNKIAQSKRNNSKEQLGVRVGKVINKYKMGKFVKVIEINDKKFLWQFDQEKIDKEASLDGCYVIFTDVSPQDMGISDAVKTYKDLAKIENAFRNMKTVELELRPFYHRTDKRIDAHAFICMLAYYLMWHVNKKLAPLFKNDNDGKNQKYTFSYIMQRLESIRKNKVSFLGVDADIITDKDPEQDIICTLLGLSF